VALAYSIRQNWIASAYPLEYGGLSVGLAKTAIAGKKGMEIELETTNLSSTEILFSESLGRVLITVNPANAQPFEQHMGSAVRKIGVVKGDHLSIRHKNETIVNASIAELERAYKRPLGDF
jgi:phosphoribosylformylglycinamidine synthase